MCRSIELYQFRIGWDKNKKYIPWPCEWSRGEEKAAIYIVIKLITVLQKRTYSDVCFDFLIEVLICSMYIVDFHFHEFTYYYKVFTNLKEINKTFF